MISEDMEKRFNEIILYIDSSYKDSKIELVLVEAVNLETRLPENLVCVLNRNYGDDVVIVPLFKLDGVDSLLSTYSLDLENFEKSNKFSFKDILSAMRKEDFDRIQELIEEHFPHGSGLDGRTTIDQKSILSKIIFHSEYHLMNDVGFYMRWINFSIILTPSFAHRFDLKITGNFGKDGKLIKEYLYDVYQEFFDSVWVD
jgi:hypothetical protein